MAKKTEQKRSTNLARKRSFDGVVVKKTGEKTVSVQVTRVARHPLYLKKVVRTKKYLTHDEKNEAKEGDRVTIVECRPRSRRKRWQLATINQVSAKNEN